MYFLNALYIILHIVHHIVHVVCTLWNIRVEVFGPLAPSSPICLEQCTRQFSFIIKMQDSLRSLREFKRQRVVTEKMHLI